MRKLLCVLGIVLCTSGCSINNPHIGTNLNTLQSEVLGSFEYDFDVVNKRGEIRTMIINTKEGTYRLFISSSVKGQSITAVRLK